MKFPLPHNLRTGTPDNQRMVAMFFEDGTFCRGTVTDDGFMPCLGRLSRAIGYLEISQALALSEERRVKHEGRAE